MRRISSHSYNQGIRCSKPIYARTNFRARRSANLARRAARSRCPRQEARAQTRIRGRPCLEVTTKVWRFDSRYLCKPSFPESQEAEAWHHCRRRLGPRRPSGGDRPQNHGHRSDLQQIDQRLRTCSDDGLVRNFIPSYQWVVKAAGTSPTASPVLRCRGHARRRGCGRPHRPWRTPLIEALRHASSLST